MKQTLGMVVLLVKLITLDWPPGRRVGWFVGVVLGVAAGGAFLWYMPRD